MKSVNCNSTRFGALIVGHRFMILIGCALVSPLIAQSVEHVALHRASAEVLTGIDVLQQDGFRGLEGRKVGLITNQTGINRNWVSTVQLMHNSKVVDLVALFSPEHGFEGKLEVARIGDSRDTKTGLTIHSLYGKTRIPTKQMMDGIDTLVFDIQDIGTRFYTYISTMGNAMRAAAENGVRFVVLDRPNPINGRDVQGPVLDVGNESFVGFHRIPVRHGMTVGELARMFHEELELTLDLTVIPVEGWDRDSYFDETGLPWINPSPNMRSLTQAILYPGIGLLETTNLSVGRGTDTPFEIVGAPWLDGIKMARHLNASRPPGVTFVPIRFTPNASKYKDEICYGINIVITNRDQFHPLHTGIEVALALRRFHGQQWQTKSLNRLLSHQRTFQLLLEKTPVDKIQANYRRELDVFRARRKRYLLY